MKGRSVAGNGVASSLTHGSLAGLTSNSVRSRGALLRTARHPASSTLRGGAASPPRSNLGWSPHRSENGFERAVFGSGCPSRRLPRSSALIVEARSAGSEIGPRRRRPSCCSSNSRRNNRRRRWLENETRHGRHGVRSRAVIVARAARTSDYLFGELLSQVY